MSIRPVLGMVRMLENFRVLRLKVLAGDKKNEV
jgi:hypothetical protein